MGILQGNTGPSYQSTHVESEYHSPSSATNSPSERDALNGSGRRGANTLVGVLLLLASVVLSAILFETSAHAINQCPLSYEARARQREEWRKEAFAQELLRHEWQREKQDQELFRLEWALEKKHHEEAIEKQRQHEEEYEEIVRQEWQKEMENHLKHQEEQRLEWEREADAYRREMDKQRLEWKREWDQHERLERDRRQREKQGRQKMNMFWGQVEAHHCTTYATREYTALLKNLPVNYPYRVEACKETPLEIHGVPYLPKDCEDKGPGNVMGRWEVDHDEPDCVTFWNWYKDKGCTSENSGKRRIEHYMENLPKGGDWREFCASTPADFLGMHFTGPHICFQFDLGTYGHWELDDSNC